MKRFLCKIGVHKFVFLRILTSYKAGFWVRTTVLECERCLEVKEKIRRVF